METRIFTDGSCLRNPGPGGYGVIVRDGAGERELSGGFAHTTNNRMELLAVIRGLAMVPVGAKVVVCTDSQYAINGIAQGWAKGWRARGWVKKDKQPALNPDLWDLLLNLCEERQVRFEWVRGHTGHPENERCDRLAYRAAQQPNLPPDTPKVLS